MPKERLNLLKDYIFHKNMGEKGYENHLLAFLNAVLGRTGDKRLTSIEIIENRTLTAEIIGDKSSVLDVRARTADGTLVNIEVQLRNLGNMDRRSLFYWSLEYARSLESGQDYHELPKVIAINIINFEFIPARSFHTRFHLWEDTEKELLLTDALEIHFVDMIKFRRLGERDIRNDPLHRWLTYFDKHSPEGLVAEVIQMDEAIQKAQERVAFITNDKEALRAYQMREMAISDWTSGVNHARREGRREGQQDIARNFKAMGIPIEQIAQGTGLTEEQIRGL
jgi:predicted transposase/invertase (TIGR01784 family)